MAYRRYCIDDMLGIVLWIHWFCISSKKDICDFIFAKLINNPNITKYDIMDSLIENRMVIEPVKSENFKAVLPSQNDLKSDWSLDNFRNDIQKYPWITLFNRIFWNRQIMIFAERKYFNETFDYDPALTNFNSGHNRPWDVDHIVPQAWMSLQGKQFGEWKKFCVEWLWSIGNLAAIPFSINRSKNDKAVWNAYCENAEELLFDEKIKDLDEGITFCTDKAYLFATACRDRIISFYEDLLKILPYRF